MFDSREVQVMGDEELVDALRRAHGAAAFAQAAEITAVRELYRRHRASNAAPGPGGVRAGEFAAAEVAVAVQVSETVAAALIDIGLALDELPQTQLAFAAGRIDLARVQVIAETTRGLAREVREAVEPKLIDVATRSDPIRLRQTARRWVARYDPDGERQRREDRERDRDVRIRSVQDGMAVFDGLLPAAGAQIVANRLRELAAEVCADDPRSMPQRRADALVALADGSGWLRCECGHGERCPQEQARPEPRARGGSRTDPNGSELSNVEGKLPHGEGTPRHTRSSPVRAESQVPRQPLIQVGVSAETLAGIRNDPALLAGYGPIDAPLARAMLEYARVEVVPEPPTPRAGAERSSSQLPEEVRAVDGLCRFPGCPMPATDTQLTYVEATNPRPRLPGMAHVAALCTRHHRLKMLVDRGSQAWRIRRPDTDRIEWTDPTGETHTTTREGARYLFPHTDIEAPRLPPTPYERVNIHPPYPFRSLPADLSYPIDGHTLIHPQLSRCTPENDIPDALPVRATE
ncbi:DUF222 domain-containing protein [Nocardia uniformis]|uniref:DUF222 domain-containing protein n=1 Tax=Nocardia uniformis TaxID=53432 RepID=A0A849BWK0_9NOCA|nr:DUF222 domain-containing protein [Nocardia uniformis]NNH69508.1 DUF222 domain-containing protein [Nocardia uniformis]